jgi:hypothetical protein
MNIFFLSLNVTKCAKLYCDQHVIKILLEIVQMLYTAWHLSGEKPHKSAYKIAHPNHPMCMWVRASRENYIFTTKLGMALTIEYTYRFGKCHACTKHILWLYTHIPQNFEFKKSLTAYYGSYDIPQCMPPEHHRIDPVLAYWSYYKTKTFAKWTKRNKPSLSKMLLRQPTVIRWLKGDLSFLPSFVHKNKTADIEELKKLEDTWGREMLKLKRPDLNIKNQWSGVFGEEICKEAFHLMGKNIKKPVKKNNYQPDFEVDDYIIEVKNKTYFTMGTAGEKILGVPFKYAEIPELYNKPLRILCIGGAEKACKEYGILDPNPIKQKYLDFFAENKIMYVTLSDFLPGLRSLETPDSLNLSLDDKIVLPIDTP